MVLIGSHYDTVKTSPGVNDNGSGMTALLQALKLFTNLGNNIIFGHFFVFFKICLRSRTIISCCDVTSYHYDIWCKEKTSHSFFAYASDINVFAVTRFDKAKNSFQQIQFISGSFKSSAVQTYSY